MPLNYNSNDVLLRSLGVERDRDTYKINSASHITLVLVNLTDKIDKLRKSQSTISEQQKKSEISKNIDELKKASLDILFTEYEKQYNLFTHSELTTQAKNPYALISEYEVVIQAKGIANSKKLSRAEFEEVLISGHDKHSTTLDFDISSNLPLNIVIISHSDYIEKLKSSKPTIPKYITDALSEIDDFYNDNNYKDNNDRINKKLGVLITFRESTDANPSEKKTADNKIFDILYEFFLELKEKYKNTISMQPLDRKKFEEQYKLGNNEDDFALNFVINKYKNLEFSGVKIYEPQRIGKSLSNTPDISRELKSTWDSIVNGLKFNSDSTSYSLLPSSLPDTLSNLVKSINEFKAPTNLFFKIPNQWSQDSGGSDFQPSWLDSAVNKSKSFVTSLSGVFGPQKLEPSPEDDRSIQEEMRQKVKESLAKRFTTSPEKKTSSPEKAKSGATRASLMVQNEANATAEKRKRVSSSPPAQMRRTSSAHPAPLRAAPPAQMRRISSAPPAPREINQELKIEFLGKGTKKHREHPHSEHPEANKKSKLPNANGPKDPSASNLHPQPLKRPRTK
jgi:hypothetical protein